MLQGMRLSNAMLAAGYLAALVMTAVATALAMSFRSVVAIPNLSLIYVLPVVIAAVVFGLGPSLFSAVLGALAYNFFFAPPLYTLQVEDPANIWAIALFFVVGCIASAVASIARRRAEDATLLKRQAASLQAYGRDLVACRRPNALLALTASALEAVFEVPVVVLLVSEGSVKRIEKRGGAEPAREEIEAARYALSESRPVPASVYPYDTSRFDFWPASTGEGQQAVIGLMFDPDERPSDPGVVVETVASLLALALDRRHILRAE